jgi:magnesium-transporting ATPase (P-type)
MNMTSGNNVPEQQTQPSKREITPVMLRYLKKTKPWVRFISVVIFIGTGLVFLLGLALILGAGLLSSLSKNVFGGAPLGLLGFVYTVFACLSFFPALYLARFADGIKKALLKDEVGGIEDALKNQRAFWRYMGVLLLAILVLQIAAILTLVFFAVGFGARR